MFTTRPELQGSVGMVSSTHWLASAAGMAVLEAGGNAFDAAVTAGFTLQVVEPHLNGPGGDLPLIFAGPDVPPTVLCAQGPAPAGATIEHYRGLGLDLVPGSGLLAAAVPGATAGWLTLLRDHGTARLRDVWDAAIHYATTGIPVLPSIARTIGQVAELFRDDWTPSAALYLAGDAAPQAGDWHRNAAWAATLRRLLGEAEAATSDRDGQIEHALRSWTTGFVAEAIDSFARTAWRDSSGERHAGVLTGEDLAAWRPSYEPPTSLDFHGWTVCKTGPWGQGPVLLQQLALLDGLDAQPGTADFVHTVVEASKLAFADREAWYGDAADVPMAELLGAEYNAQRRTLIGDRADGDLRPGSPAGREPVLPDAILRAPARPASDVTTAEPTVSRTGETRGDTCHVSVADRFGNLVAATPSGGWLQSSPVIDTLGFPLGTRVQMMWLQPGLPNSLTPGRRPRTTLSPSLALRNGEPALAFGSPGGDQQDQWQLSFFLNHVLGGLNLQESIDAPSFHSTHFPSSFYPREAFPRQVVIEDRFDPEVLTELERRGHELVRSDGWSLGRLCAVARGQDGRLRAAANPRGMQGYAVGR
ncbi:MAG TPA: gamma-glutamyltransferase family protein [Jatrophihabitantaceae bacterium]|nr:gamma-glutamyltransferase family protein [Jatrophihabitantaceae bacterium]